MGIEVISNFVELFAEDLVHHRRIARDRPRHHPYRQVRKFDFDRGIGLALQTRLL